MKNKLLLVAISGVQNYIKQARKTVDLYQGSRRVLEELNWIKDELKQIYEANNNFNIILPVANKNQGDCSSNFFIARINNLQDTNEKIEEEIKAKLGSRGQCKETNEDLPCFIVVVDYVEGEYEKSYKKLYAKYQAYKNNRLNVLSFIKEDDTATSVESKIYRVDEQMCVLCGKRIGKYEDIVQQKCKGYICNQCNKKRQSKNSFFPSTQDIAGKGGYYALVQLDIDDMGKWLSGDYKEDKEDLLRYQQGISSRINGAFDEIENSIPKLRINGKEEIKTTIYSGGDDMLFFCPVDNVWSIISDVDKKLKNKFQNQAMTCTKSIVIAHEKEPLRYVIGTARKQLEETKKYFNKEGKNGIGITLLYHGSGKRSVYIKDDKGEFSDKTKELVHAFSNKVISKSLIHCLEEIVCLGEQMQFDEYQVLRLIIENEIKRIITRKVREGNRESIQNHLLYFLDLFSWFNNGSFCISMHSYMELLHIIEKLSKHSCIEEKVN